MTKCIFIDTVEQSWTICSGQRKSSDLNSIEHAFYLLKVDKKNSSNNQEVQTAAVKAWKSITRKFKGWLPDFRLTDWQRPASIKADNNTYKMMVNDEYFIDAQRFIVIGQLHIDNGTRTDF